MGRNNEDFHRYKQMYACTGGNCNISDHVTLYRGISFEPHEEGSWSPTAAHGVHWSSDESVARQFASQTEHGVVIEAKVHPGFEMPRQKTDGDGVVSHNLDTVLRGVYDSGHAEKETPLSEGSPVHVTRYTRLRKAGKKRYDEIGSTIPSSPLMGSA